ncbi:hypothetical protein NM688_g6011 [Phlebia brevispora]|uniref:Uncharacterized protein n=1 Tax=Phlebia brevispora TaxID=194682 RepID=A0ACC1SLL3_9APHY|nr:hypothetical protein NM688_g6011 [Phlebia brevispora]
MSGPSFFALAAETFVITSLRSALFFASRKYLLRNLYHDLQDPSSDAEPLLSSTDTDIELETLPTPSTATLPSNSSLQALKSTFHSTLSRTLFSLCFSESCTLFALLICQGLDVFQARIQSRAELPLNIWQADVAPTIPHQGASYCLSCRTFPFLAFLRPITGRPPDIKSMANCAIALDSNWDRYSGLTLRVRSRDQRVAIFPVLLQSREEPTDSDVRAAEDGLERVRSDLAARKRSIQQLQAQQSDGAESTSWFSKVATNFRGDSELSSATLEIRGLEALEYQMARNLRALKQHREEAKFSRTISGRLFYWAGRLFAVYCVYRTVMAAVNVMSPTRVSDAPAPTPQEPVRPRTNTDVLTILLAHALSLFPSIQLSPDEVAVVSRQISLGLVGIIILSSIRTVLRGVARALRVTSRRLGASLMLLMFAQVMGIYLLSTLVQLRTSFPPPSTRPDTTPDIGLVNLFSTLPEYQVFGSVFDSAFLLAAVVSAITLWFYHRINSVGVVDTS